MNKAKKISLGYVAMQLMAGVCFTQEAAPSDQSIASQYVDAYVKMKFKALAKYYTDTSSFQDPTLTLISADAAQVVFGMENIIEKLKKNFSGVKRQKYVLRENYTVGEYNIYSGVYSYAQNATEFGGPDVVVDFSLRSTTILKERDGKILEHVEYMDYARWYEQYEAQTNEKK